MSTILSITRTPTADPTITPAGLAEDGAGDSDGGGALEQKVALAALIIAVIAFFATFFQLLLQYLTSNSRDKCLSGAIGRWSYFTKTRWNVWRWRLNVQYARLDMTIPTMLTARFGRHDELIGYIWDFMWLLPSDRYEVVSSEGSEISALKDGGYAIRGQKSGKFVTFWDFPWIMQPFVALNMLVRRDRQPLVKAGWANLMMALSIYPEKIMVKGHEAADVIPSSVDVPMQRIQLFDLATLCYMIGIKDVEIDTQNGTIKAQSALIKFSTQIIPGLGQAVTIDGDFLKLQDKMHKTGSNQLLRASNFTLGIFDGPGKFKPTIYYMEERVLIYATAHGWEESEWKTYQSLSAAFKFSRETEGCEDYLRAISPRFQCDQYRKRVKGNTGGLDGWEGIGGHVTPTMIKYLGIMPFLSVWTAGPFKLFFNPYKKFVNKCRGEWMAAQGNGIIPNIRQHPQVEEALTRGLVPFLDTSEDFCLTSSFGEVFKSAFSWMSTPVASIVNEWDSEPSTSCCFRPFETTIALPKVVIDLLNSKPIDEARAYLRARNFALQKVSTLESAIMLSLLMVDARLQALWCVMQGKADGWDWNQWKYDDPNGSNEEYGIVREVLHAMAESPDRKKLLEQDDPAIDNSSTNVRMRIFWLSKPLRSSFMAFWFELGAKSNLLGNPGGFRAAVESLLAEWGNDESSCVVDIEPMEEMPEKCFAAVQGSQTKKEFVAFLNDKNIPPPELLEPNRPRFWWEGKVKEGKKSEVSADEAASSKSAQSSAGNDGRLKVFYMMLSVMQLRMFLMDLSFRCHADSSKVCEAKHEGAATVDVLLI